MNYLLSRTAVIGCILKNTLEQTNWNSVMKKKLLHV